MKKLFPHTLWNRDTTSLLGCAASKFIVFDIIWCLQTTFTSFSLPEVYVNSLLAALLFILPFILTGKKWLEYLVLFILDGLLISNLMYCRTYNSMIPLESYLLASNLSDFTASVIDSMRWIDALLPLSTLICIYSLHKRKNRGAEASGRERGAYALRIKQYALTTLAAFLLSVILIFAKGGPEKAFNNLDNANMYTCKVPMYTIFGNLIHEANQQKTVFTPKIKAEIDDWMKQQPAYQPLADSIARKKTLVVIFCESPAAKGIVSDKQFTPFIVVNAPVGGIYNKVMGQVDQYPTILNLMHLDHYKWKGMGQSIFDPRKYPAAVGSDNMNVETTGNVPEKEIKRLTQAHRISDFLIRYDKIIK